METRDQIKKMDAQELKRALILENHRIMGENVMRRKNQMWACFAGVGSFVLCMFLQGNFPISGLMIPFWFACFVVCQFNRAKKLHWEYGFWSEDSDEREQWEAKSREILLEALDRRNRAYAETDTSEW